MLKVLLALDSSVLPSSSRALGRMRRDEKHGYRLFSRYQRPVDVPDTASNCWTFSQRPGDVCLATLGV